MVAGIWEMYQTVNPLKNDANKNEIFEDFPGQLPSILNPGSRGLTVVHAVRF